MSADDPETVRRIQALFPRELGLPAPDPTVDLIETGAVDSLALIDLLAALELEFSIRIDISALDPEQFRSVVTIAALVLESQAPTD